MSSVFTVAVDLSKIKKAPPFLFHILVDSSQISVFIEFIELVRSMFSITEHVRFLHQSGYIHYLEDIRILSVLQEVQAECYVPEESEKEKMGLLVKTLRFYDKSQNFPKILLNRLRINFDNQTGEIIGADNENDENSDDELLDISNHKIMNENGTKGKEITSQIQLLAIEPKIPLDATNFNIDKSQMKIPINKNPDNQKQLNISEVDNKIPNENKKSNFKRSQIQRPFTLGGLLETLRNEVSAGNNFPNEEPLNNSCKETQNNFNSTIEDDGEETSNNDSFNKKRKRVRKHRSRKRKQNIPNSNETLESLEDLDEPESFVPSKTRHVRFRNPDDPEEDLAKANNASSSLTLVQVWEELEQKKNILENEPKKVTAKEAADDNFKAEGEETDCSATNTKAENNTNHVPQKSFPPELNGLLTFKKKNSSPVVFKRFDDVVFKNETF